MGVSRHTFIALASTASSTCNLILIQVQAVYFIQNVNLFVFTLIERIQYWVCLHRAEATRYHGKCTYLNVYAWHVKCQESDKRTLLPE